LDGKHGESVLTNPVNWFEIPVRDMDRARKFYEAVLSIQLTPFQTGPLNMAWFPEVRDGQGTTGSLVKAESYVPSHSGTMVYFSVDDIEATLASVVKSGGKVLNPKTGIGQYGFVAHFEDCEGNRVALHSTK
jgi:predicted enzyme related to lactoylglutathione lyase